MSSSSKTNMVIDDGFRSKARNNKMILFVVAVVIVIIIVGVLSGVLSGNREKDKCDERVKEAVLAAKGDESASTTKSPRTTKPSKKSTTAKPPATTAKPSATTPPSNEPWDQIRLPNDVAPTHYDMFISVYLDTLNFSGKSNISINVSKPTDKILFHINKINITKVGVAKQDDSESLAIDRTFPSPRRQFFVVILRQPMAIGKYKLMLDFVANIETKELNGFYKSTYKDNSGKERVLAATDFQPTDARKAFPCFDEPAMKATFTISIEHRDDYTALSNMNNISSVNVGNNRRRTSFAESVPMPTYLVGMIVSDFKYLEDKTGQNNITLRTWATPLQYKDSKYSLDIAKNITPHFEEYYGVPYPLPKQDMVALPDFNSGAMENWGIITYRETAMLYKPGVSSETNKQRVALVVSHELAHMWFGNLVSCKWWNDIWLNEGFASYVEYIGVHEAEPDWEFKEQFLTNDLHRAFRLDALASSHPIQVEVNDPEEIKTVFDSITYSKGASIIRMLSDFLTEEKFKDGLKKYLIKYKYGSAETKDLWAVLSKTSGKNVTNLMETWTEQMGYPVINIARAGSGKGNADQKHFLLDPKAKVTESSRFDYKWTVKLNYITESNLNETIVWMHRSSAQLDWPDGKWIKANVGQYGYYRVNYERENWEQLTNVLKTNHMTLSSADRTSLIDDAFNLARAGQLDYDIPLNLSSYVKKEDRYVPWRAFMTAIGFLNTMLSTQDSYGKFQEYMLDVISKKIVDVGWEKNKGEKHLDAYMRSLILSAACSYGNEGSNKNVTRLFLGYLNENETLDVDLKSMIYYHGIANTGYKEWDKLFEKYRNSSVASEKSKLLYGLAGSRQPWVLQRFLRYSIQKDKVRDQDTVTVVSYVARNAVGREYAWKFLKENWNEFYKRYAKSSFRMASVITSTTSWMNKKIDLEDVKAFFESREDLGSGKRSADQAIERIQSNIEWVKRSAGTIAEYLDKY